MRLLDNHRDKFIWINWAGYSFQREWGRWNKWRRTFLHGHHPVIRSRGTWLRSSPPQSGSAGETQAGLWVQFSGTSRTEKNKYEEFLTFTWKTVRIAAGNVSKLVVGVSPSKLNLQGENKQSLNVITLQSHRSHIHSSTYWRMEQYVLSIRLLQIIPAQWTSITLYSSVSGLCDLMADLWLFILLKWMSCANADILYLCLSTGT